MSPPESEWMLWAKRLRTSIRTELDEELEALPSRYAQLVQDTTQLASLKTEVKDLAKSYEHLHHSNLALQSEAKIWQGTTLHLTKNLEHVVGTLDQFKRDSLVAEEQQQLELQALRKQIEGLTKSPGTERRDTAAMRPFSEATTTDNGLSIAVTSPSPHSGLPCPQQNDCTISQGRLTYEEYLASGEGFIRAVLEQAELQAVKAYVQGMRQPFRKKPVWEALEAKGWTWENARHELQKIVDEGKRRRRSRRTIQLPPLKVDT
ncbi:MAG: hypothetical protein Q9201_000229 [Fulgogasparrea decipioides]